MATGQSATRVGELREGWNRLRLVADIESQTVVFYINDMDVPSSEPLTFGRPIDSWANAELIFAQHRNIKGAFFYGDVKVWSLETEEQAQSRRAIELATTPIWIEYHEVAQKPAEWWESDEARFLAERIIRRMKEDEITIDILIGTLTVPDGILATQLSVLAHMYARTGEGKYKEAFQRGLNVLLEAQFPSGGWPTVYPRYKDRDLHDDFTPNPPGRPSWHCCGPCWVGVSLYTDIATPSSRLRWRRLYNAYRRRRRPSVSCIPIMPGEALNGGHLTKRYKSAITCSHGRYPKADGDG